jgi:hypothetical protein
MRACLRARQAQAHRTQVHTDHSDQPTTERMEQWNRSQNPMKICRPILRSCDHVTGAARDRTAADRPALFIVFAWAIYYRCGVIIIIADFTSGI